METLKDKKILVIGGAGFIGSHLVRELAKEDCKITVTDNLYRSTTKHIDDLINSGKVIFVKGDIRDRELMDKLTKDTDYVFHLAAVCINYSTKNPAESLEINLMGSNNVFEFSAKNGVKKVIFSSSASVYGEPERLPMNENDRLNPITPYCIAKLASEQLLNFYSKQGLKFNILRYFNVYGLKQSADAYYTSVIIAFIKRIINNQAPMISGDGSQSMDFVNVKDIVSANILALKSDVENEIFNVGTGKSTTIAELANILLEGLGKKDLKPEFDGRKVIVSQRRADISKISKMLGYKVTVDTEAGLKEVGKDIFDNQQDY